MNQKKGLQIVVGIISALISLGIAGFSFYLSSLKNYWFILIAIYFVLDGLFIFITLGIKDAYKAMRVQGVWQIFSVILMMDYLLVMSLWNDPEHLIVVPLSYYVYGAAAGAKLLTFFIGLIGNHKEYKPVLHAFRNNDLINLFYLLLMIELIIMNQFFPGNTTNIFENLFQEKPIWVYIVDIICNATLTILAAFLALSTEIRAKEKQELSVGGKIKHTVKWFNDNEVAMFFGLIFTLYLAWLALVQVKQSVFYIFLAAFYLGSGLIRFINYLWHKAIQKRCNGNLGKENRLSAFILLFDSFAYLFFSNVICVGAIMIMLNKINAGSNLYLFLFLIVPFAIFRLINAGREIKAGRQLNDTYKTGNGYISLISAVFAILEITAISTYYLHTSMVALKYILIIGVVILVKVFVLIICLMFIISFFRGLIGRRKTAK